MLIAPDFKKAVEDNDIEKVNAYLAHYKNNPGALNAVDDVGKTALFFAAGYGHIEIVRPLLGAGANVNQANNNGATSLFIAAQNGRLNVVNALIAAGANVNQARNDGVTPLYVAAQIGQLDVIKALIAAGANVNQAMNDGATPLLIAVQNGQLDVIKALIAVGADITLAYTDANGNRYTPLDIAKNNGHSEIVKLFENILELGNNLRQAASDNNIEKVNAYLAHYKNNPGALNAVDNIGRTALFFAAGYGHIEIVRSLLGAGANVNQAMKDGSTSLYIAAQKGHLNVINALIAAGADITLAYTDANGNRYTPLDIAKNNGHSEIVNLFENILEIGNSLRQAAIDNDIEKVNAYLSHYKNNPGAMNAVDNTGRTALFFAASYGHIEIVRSLLGAGANVNQANNNGATSLFIAAQNGRLNVVNALIAARANIDQARNDGVTPLLIAAKNGNLNAVNALIAAGANVNQAMNNGATPLYIAAQDGKLDVIKVLIAAGANVNQAKKDGATSLYVAAQNGHLNVVNALIAAGANVNQAKKDGSTSVCIAARKGRLDVVKALIAAGADINLAYTSANGKKITPLDVAIEENHPKIVLLLLTNSSLQMPEGLSPSKKLKLAIFDEIECIDDRKKRKTILLDAAGKGARGKEHPLHKFIKYARFFSTSEDRGTLGKINQAIADIEKIEEAQQRLSSNIPKIVTTTATTMQALELAPWGIQLTKPASILSFLNDSAKTAKLLDVRDKENQTFREFLLVQAEAHPAIRDKMCEKGLLISIENAVPVVQVASSLYPALNVSYPSPNLSAASAKVNTSVAPSEEGAPPSYMEAKMQLEARKKQEFEAAAKQREDKAILEDTKRLETLEQLAALPRAPIDLTEQRRLVYGS